MATINYADIYGGVGNPAPASDQQPAPGATGKPRARGGDTAPAMVWLGILIGLVLLRLIYELS